MPCPKKPEISTTGRPSAVHIKPSAFHRGPPLQAASQPEALDLSSAVSFCISSGQRSTKPRLLLRARHSLLLPTASSAAYRRPSSDSPISSPSATIFSPTHLSTRLASCSVAPGASLADRLRRSLALARFRLLSLGPRLERPQLRIAHELPEP